MILSRWNDAAVLRIVMSDRGETTVDEIRTALAEMEGTEDGLLVERTRLSPNLFRALLSYLGLGSLLQIGLLAATGLFVGQAQIADQAGAKSETAMREALAMLIGTRAIAPNLVTVGHAT